MSKEKEKKSKQWAVMRKDAPQSAMIMTFKRSEKGARREVTEAEAREQAGDIFKQGVELVFLPVGVLCTSWPHNEKEPPC